MSVSGDRFVWRHGPQSPRACETCGIAIVHPTRAGARRRDGSPVAFEAFVAVRDPGCWQCVVCSSRDEREHELPVDAPLFHLTAPANRASIGEHGLDWTRMGAAPGIAGWHTTPELAGVFLGDLWSVGFFATFRTPLDIWKVERPEAPLEDGPDGWLVSRRAIPAARVRLIQADDWFALRRPGHCHDIGWTPTG